MDWTFLKSSLDVFKWFKIEAIHVHLYFAKLESLGIKERKVGDKIPKCSKFLIGVLLILFIMILLFGPMIIFSTINPSKQQN